MACRPFNAQCEGYTVALIMDNGSSFGEVHLALMEVYSCVYKKGYFLECRSKGRKSESSLGSIKTVRSQAFSPQLSLGVVGMRRTGNEAKFHLASYPGLLTPVFVACSTNVGEGLVKLVTCSDVHGCVEEWHILSVQLRDDFLKCHQDCLMSTAQLLHGPWLRLVVYSLTCSLSKNVPFLNLSCIPNVWVYHFT